MIEVQLIVEDDFITKLLLKELEKYNLDNVEFALWEKYFQILNETQTGLWFYGPTDLSNWLDQEYHELVMLEENDPSAETVAEMNGHYLVRYY